MHTNDGESDEINDYFYSIKKLIICLNLITYIRHIRFKEPSYLNLINLQPLSDERTEFIRSFFFYNT